MKAALGLAEEAPVFLAGSTGDGEEPHVLAAFQTVRAAYPAARLVLVPRHIQRTPEIEGYVRDAGLTSVRRTQLPAQAERSRAEQCVVIVDTLGELARLYALATVAFVGRSLVPQGGSNVLQAAAQGKPVLFGPDVSNVRDSAHLLLQHGVAWQVPDHAALGTQVCALLANPARLADLDRAARALIAANRGSARRTVEALTELLRSRTTPSTTTSS
jgi:3-deoxy-D-manno-octulosonic-acid transferase